MAQASIMEYAVVEGWEQLPTGYAHRDVAGVAVDGEDRVYLSCRGDHPIIVYDQQGNFLRSWGEGAFTARTHGISVAVEPCGILRTMKPEYPYQERATKRCSSVP